MTGKARRERNCLRLRSVAYSQFYNSLCSHFIALLFLSAIRYGNEAEDTDSSGEEDGEEGKFWFLFQLLCYVPGLKASWKENETILNHPQDWYFKINWSLQRSFWRTALKYARARQDKEELSGKLNQTPNQTILLHFRRQTEISGCPFVCEQLQKGLFGLFSLILSQEENKWSRKAGTMQ